MLLAAWYYGALVRAPVASFLPVPTICNSLPQGERQLFTLCRARIFRLATPAFVHALSCPKRTAVAIDSLLGWGIRQGQIHCWGSGLVNNYTRKTMKTLVVALGGNALLQRVRR